MILKEKSSDNIKIETFQVNLVADPDVIYVINRNFISDSKNKTKQKTFTCHGFYIRFAQNLKQIEDRTSIWIQIWKIFVLVTDEYIKQKNKHSFYK
jgi:hypothetical protein